MSFYDTQTFYNGPHKTRNGGGYGIFSFNIITGVVISIIASSCSENKNYSGYHGGDMRKFIGKK